MEVRDDRRLCEDGAGASMRTTRQGLHYESALNPLSFAMVMDRLTDKVGQVDP